ncbi:hypothetical protein Vadar_013834 [Vaccinium darrowii]|uniref:Uncharacterized protein n=1 Tax=Vaccinium darrowii TaxID=229202 RepID=A0ACB7ZBL4_9ERIC|nr:hypothetical protein Vadar_013834 [Vaccinium darrowii]
MGTVEKQGIVSILRSDFNQSKAPSLRRTLSADMSSKKWLGQNGFSPMKRTASSEKLINFVADSSSSDEGEDECRGKNKEDQKPGQFDVWSSILLSKKPTDDESSKLPPPYVHPLVKRSTSALSEKSLEICTESLGSETGSDVFSSYAPSETGDAEEDKEELQQQQQLESQHFDREESRATKSNYSKKVSPKPFPPPLPSLARCDGPALHMHSHRENGRLVLEAVSIPSQNYFHAQREDGRLVLTFANNIPDSKEPNHGETYFDQEEEEEEVIDRKQDEVAEIDEIFETIEDEEDGEEDEEEEEEMVKVEDEDGAKEIELLMEQTTKFPSGAINVHRSPLMMKKLIGLDNRNPTWTNKYNKPVHFVNIEAEEEGQNPLAQSLPRPPRLARLIPSPPAAATTAASFNTYEYFWRAKPTVATAVNPPYKNSSNKVIYSNSTPKAYEEQGMVLLSGNKAEYWVPLLNGCKESRRSLLILGEPYCVAT